MKKALTFVLITASANLWAEDNYEFDLDFNIKGKSTIENFKLKEIASQELSEAVIEGALQRTSAGSSDVRGKPAHAEQAEKEAKEKDSEVIADAKKELINTDEFMRLNDAVAAPPELRFDSFQEPNGRVYGLDSHTTYSNER